MDEIAVAVLRVGIYQAGDLRQAVVLHDATAARKPVGLCSAWTKPKCLTSHSRINAQGIVDGSEMLLCLDLLRATIRIIHLISLKTYHQHILHHSHRLNTVTFRDSQTCETLKISKGSIWLILAGDEFASLSSMPESFISPSNLSFNIPFFEYLGTFPKNRREKIMSTSITHRKGHRESSPHFRVRILKKRLKIDSIGEFILDLRSMYLLKCSVTLLGRGFSVTRGGINKRS